MTNLPLIVSFGGINAAGRSSHHHAYRRMVLDSISVEAREDTIIGLAVMMGLLTWDSGANVWKDKVGNSLSSDELISSVIEEVINGTLIREIGSDFFDVDSVPTKNKITLVGDSKKQFSLSKRHLPKKVPDNWQLSEIDDKNVKVSVEGDFDVLIDSSREIDVKSAGQIPEGFNPSELYNSRYHPRGLQMAVVAAADAINSLGIPWEKVLSVVSPDQVAVYASSSLSQMDENSNIGLLQARLKGERVSSKQLALGFNSMPADFVNAYICGNVGGTGSMTGACASFLYNLKLGCEDIKEGRKRVVIIGGSEAPVTSEIVEGFDAMGALARKSQLEKIDGGETNLRHSSRAFGDNCGFTIAESAQYIVLMDDALTVELGADIHGAVGDVYVSSDGFKKSISSPGVGNYITMSKAVASAIAIAGDDVVKNKSFIHSHGSSTPQNRVTESEIFDKIAEVFDIKAWPVTAVKAAVGHSLGSASGDQLVAALGTFKYGYLPGIKTINKVAEDVVDKRLNIATKDMDIKGQAEIAFLNSKGFGGNNASAFILSPKVSKKILSKRFSKTELDAYEARLTITRDASIKYDKDFVKGEYQTIYSFGQSVIDESEIEISRNKISIPGYAHDISLDIKNPYL